MIEATSRGSWPWITWRVVALSLIRLCVFAMFVVVVLALFHGAPMPTGLKWAIAAVYSLVASLMLAQID